jgi:hypothetical protein
MSLLLLLSPLLIVTVTWVTRAYGPRIGGLLTGLPLTSGPVSLFLANERGASFAARAAVGAIAGTVGVAVFCTVYGRVGRRRAWPWALGAGLLAFSFVGTLLTAYASTWIRGALVGIGVSALIAYGAYVFSSRTRLAPAPPAVARPPPAWDLPARVLVSTGLVAVLTLTAQALGPAWSGVLSALPVFTAVLAVFTRTRDGRDASTKLLAGVATGSIGSHVFFLVVGASVTHGRLLVVYPIAIAAALFVNWLVAWCYAAARDGREKMTASPTSTARRAS